VLYSSTKHLGGHGDTTGGVLATSREIAHKMREQLKLTGGVASPFDAWLVLRGLRTLDLRVRKQSQNACLLTDWLVGDQRVDAVYYPGRTGPLPKDQFQDGLMGTMLAFEIKGATTADVFRFQDALAMIQPATTLGDVHTIVLDCHRKTAKRLGSRMVSCACRRESKMLATLSSTSTTLSPPLPERPGAQVTYDAR
jgi:cystathionine gamma-synthase/methionine-gamma-lyase